MTHLFWRVFGGELHNLACLSVVPTPRPVVVLDEQILAPSMSLSLSSDSPLIVFPTIPNEPPHLHAPLLLLIHIRTTPCAGRAARPGGIRGLSLPRTWRRRLLKCDRAGGVRGSAV